MGEFSILVNQVKNNIADMNQVGQSVQGVQSMVDNVRNGLSSIGLADVSPTLQSIVERLNKRKVECVSLSDALKSIINKFDSTENTIVASQTSSDVIEINEILRTYGGGPTMPEFTWESKFSVISHTYPYGDVAVDWKKIEDILAKDINDITEEEWRALAEAAIYMDADDLNKLVEKFIVEGYDENGYPTAGYDVDKYNKMLEYMQLEYVDLQIEWYNGNPNKEAEVMEAFQRLQVMSNIPVDKLGDGLVDWAYINNMSVEEYTKWYEQYGKPQVNITQDSNGNIHVEYNHTSMTDPMGLHDTEYFDVGRPRYTDSDVGYGLLDLTSGSLIGYSQSDLVGYILDHGYHDIAGKIPYLNIVDSIAGGINDMYESVEMASDIDSGMKNAMKSKIFEDLNIGYVPVTVNGTTTVLPVCSPDTAGILQECQKSTVLNQYGVNWDINEIMKDPVGYVDAMEKACNDPKFVEEYNKIISKYDTY